MTNLLFLLVCLSLGAAFKRGSLLQGNAHMVINQLLLYVCLPAATLVYASEVRLNSQMLMPVLMPWCLYIIGFVFFKLVSKVNSFSSHSEAVLIMTAGVPSVSFLGFPIFELFYGTEGLRIGILMSQAGSFMVCATLGVITASYYAAAKPSLKTILANVLGFPVFIAFMIALAMNFLHLSFPVFVKEALQKIAAPFSFLALFSVGLQIDFIEKRDLWKQLCTGLCFKLLIAPLLVWLAIFPIAGQTGIVAEICVIGAALGPMNTAAIIAIQYGLHPQLASAMVGIGLPLSLFTCLPVYYLLQWFNG
ncbi:MAG: transporter [Cytophagales bacterium]|nr:transporter [Bernardetiaceae bacterium]MDW8205543.1 transporter [Cytophagales bacterium]